MSSVTSFFKLTADELQQAYLAKEITASRYILWIIKTHGKACWKWSFNVKDFCLQWLINERTFYRAIAKLKSLGLIQWEKKEHITVWYGDNDDTTPATADTQPDTDVSPTVSHDTEIAPNPEPKPIPESSISSSNTSQISTATENELLTKYEEQLKLYGIYLGIWQGNSIIPNPRLEPVLHALNRRNSGAAERAIQAFLKWIRNAKNIESPYPLLANAINHSWS